MRSDDDAPIAAVELEAELSRPLDEAIRAAAAPVEPPAGFADRVLAARTQAAPRRWPRWGLAVAASAALAVGLFVPRERRGTVTAAVRTSVDLAGRGVAVVEGGGVLAWRVAGSRAVVTQDAGDVFYRVERGGPFVVRTPAGTVEVLGTCFRVEVEDMKIGKQGIVGAGIGAALAATVVVTVYEGKVTYANEHGKVALTAGERAIASSREGPASLQAAAGAADEASGSTAAPMTREELAQRAMAQQREIASLRARLQALEPGGAAGGAGEPPKGDDRRNYVNPTKDELLQLASECKLQWDEPKIGSQPSTIAAEQATELGLSEAERQAVNKVNVEFNAKTLAELRALYVEVVGDRATADSLSPSSLIEEITEKSPQTDLKAIFERISRERAGLQAAPADPRAMSPVERLMRLRTSLGDRYERDVGAAIGPDAARQAREKHDGWGSSHSSSYGCPDGR